MMERGNAVAVLAGDYPYRHNLVAAAIESNETALQAAVREMQEETGLVLSDPVLIHSGAYVSSGGASEKISIVYGTADTAHAGGVHGNPAESEDILTIVLPAKVFIDRVHGGEINDLKTLVVGYWFAKHRA